MPGKAWSREEVGRRVRELGEWFHNIELAGVQTAPDHFLGDYPAIVWRLIADALPQRLERMTVLDVGCNAGFFALQMKRRGAARVVGIDPDRRYLAQARLASEISGLPLELHELSVYDVARLGERFDLVLFMGVLYHLRHPLLALDLLHEHAVQGELVFQSMLRGSNRVTRIEPDYPFSEQGAFEDPSWPKLHFVEREYAHDATNWWIPNRACAEAMLRAAGFDPAVVPGTEVYLCRRVARPAADGPVYPARGTGGLGEEAGRT
jgi:tRNA (mo5U34)-methyltransferase